MKKPILLVSVGNTHTRLAACNAGRLKPALVLRTTGLTRRAFDSALRVMSGSMGFSDMAIASVVPAVTRLAVQSGRVATGCEPLVVSHKLQLGFGFDYPKPAGIGPDRLADVAAAVRLHGAPVLVLDCGTATVLNVVTAQRMFAGGAIMPGLALFNEYLHDRTALLPQVRQSGPVPAIGRSTAQALRLGAAVGYSGMIAGVLRHVRSSLQIEQAPICLTGGNAKAAVVDGALADWNVIQCPDLTLRGVGDVYQMNRGIA